MSVLYFTISALENLGFELCLGCQGMRKNNIIMFNYYIGVCIDAHFRLCSLG